MNRYHALTPITQIHDTINCIRFSPDGLYVAIGSDDYKTRIFAINTSMCLVELIGPNPVTAIFWNPLAGQDHKEYEIFLGYGEGSVVAYVLDLWDVSHVRHGILIYLDSTGLKLAYRKAELSRMAWSSISMAMVPSKTSLSTEPQVIWPSSLGLRYIFANYSEVSSLFSHTVIVSF